MKNSKSKIILMVLIAVAIAVLPLVFLVIPQQKKAMKSFETANLVQTQANTMRNKINQIPILTQNLEADTIAAAKLQEIIPLPQKSYDIDKFLRKTIQNAGAIVVDLNMTPYTDFTLEEKKVADDAAQTVQRIYPKMQYFSSASVTVQGNLNAILKAFDAINKSAKNFVLRGFNLQVKSLDELQGVSVVQGTEPTVVVVADGEENIAASTAPEATPTATTDATQTIGPITDSGKSATITIDVFAADISNVPLPTPSPTPVPTPST